MMQRFLLILILLLNCVFVKANPTNDSLLALKNILQSMPFTTDFIIRYKYEMTFNESTKEIRITVWNYEKEADKKMAYYNIISFKLFDLDPNYIFINGSETQDNFIIKLFASNNAPKITTDSYIEGEMRSKIQQDRFAIGSWKKDSELEKGERIKNLFHFLTIESLGSNFNITSSTDTGQQKEFFVESKNGMQRIDVPKIDTTKEERYLFGMLGNGVNPSFQGSTSKEETEKKVDEYLKAKSKADKGKGSGTVYVNFTINKTGKTTELKILKGINQTLDNLASSYIEQMTEWNPGQRNGKSVLVTYIVAVKFK